MAFSNLGIGEPPRKKTPPPPPFGAKKKPDGLAVIVGVGPEKKSPVGMDAHEASESPKTEASEGYGEKLAQEIEQAGASVGLDPAQARKAASAFFSAAAMCLSGDSSDEPPMGDAGDGAGDYPA